MVAVIVTALNLMHGVRCNTETHRDFFSELAKLTYGHASLLACLFVDCTLLMRF